MSSVGFYGCHPSLPDIRNLKFEQVSQTLPAAFSLVSQAAPVLDQGQLGSCVSNSLANVFRYLLTKDNITGEKFLPSRLTIYFDGRVLENTVSSDAGLTVADGCKVLHQSGACAEHEWPYDINRFTEEPPLKARTDATHRKAVRYESVTQNANHIKSALVSGLPVTIGISVYDSFESDEVAKTGIVPLPQQNESNLGGHCVSIYGYDDSAQLFTLQNSWGTEWGQAGFFTLPYAYVLDSNLCFELWALQLVQRVS